MMSDTFRAMRLVIVVAVVAACTDPSLRIVVDQPDGVTVARTVVTVYESDGVSCGDIAFSRLGPSELDAIQVAEQTITSDGTTSGELTDISRADHKVIVARGYGNGAAWLTAGCVEADEIEGTTTLTITAIPTVTAATVLDIDVNDPTRAVVATTDPNGMAVTDRRVTWTVYGPAGSLPMHPDTVTTPSDGTWEPALPTCTSSGAAIVHPIPPGVIGGYAVQLRAEWATQLPPLYSRLGATLAPEPLAPPAGSRTYCALHLKSDVRRVACLDAGNVRDYDIAVSGATIDLVPSQSRPIASDVFALVSVPSGLDRDLYVVTNRGALVKAFADAPDPAPLTSAPCADGTCTVDDVLVVPPCGSLPGRVLVHTTGVGAALRLLDARGGNSVSIPLPAIGLFPVQLDSAGCVTRLDPDGVATLRQVMTLHVDSTGLIGEFTPTFTRAIYGCTAAGCLGNELLAGAGVAFTTGSEPRMIVTSLDATGVVLAQVVMAPDTGTRDLLVERARIPSASVPDQLVVGQFDTDSQVDQFWTIGGRRGTSFEVAYARLVNGMPLEAISIPAPVTIDRVLSGDVSGEGRDDLVITGQFGATGPHGVLVIPMHLAAMPVAIPSDATCAP